MDEGSRHTKEEGGEAPHNAQGEVLGLADQFSGLNIRVDTRNQVVQLDACVELVKNINPDMFEFPAVVKPLTLAGKNLLLVMVPAGTEEYNFWVLERYTGAAAKSVCPPPKDEHGVFDPVALLRACKGLHVDDYTKQIMTLTGGELLSKRTGLKKLPTLQFAYTALKIPAHVESAGKAAGDGVAVAKHAKATNGGKAATKQLKATGGGKAATKLIKTSDGLVNIEDTVAMAQQIVRLDQLVAKANQQLVKAVTAAAGGGGASSGKEAKSKAAAGGGAASSGKEAKGNASVGGGAVVQVVQAPPVGGRPNKRSAPDGP